MSERRRERARFAEADLERDVGHRRLPLRQQCLRAFDAAIDVVAVRRNAEGLFEGAAEIVGTEIDELRQRME